ncbi:MAG TPA: NAD-dependent epimerase/dehydratase family protein [Gemmatimonadaceae bacterium]|nr:NAD-dependent epimerase/dehydratase family protein [Gemmatimonadaceae bacterium]
MRVFVTGGNGFIGSVVVRQLVRVGHDVVCLLRPSSNTDRIVDVDFGRVIGDVCDVEALRSGMQDCACTIHLAAPGGWSADKPQELDRVITGGTRSVLAVASQLQRHRVVLVSSTAAINGSESPRVFDERSPYTLRDPGLCYAHAKHRAESIALEACARGVDAVIVNPAEVYGPGDVGLNTAGNLLDFARARPVLVCRGGTSIVHVEDVAAGIIGAMELGRTGERYILGGDNVSVPDLARLVLELIQRHAPIIVVPRPVARIGSRVAALMHLPLPYNPAVVPYATRYWYVDSAKARRELGVSFRGARATVSAALGWLRERELL